VAESERSGGAATRPTFAYLLLTHKEPRHVEDLTARLLHLTPQAHVAVHHDAQSPRLPWGGRPAGRVHLVERGPVRWGDWSMVEATIRLLRFGIEVIGADWLVLLSGDHRPTLDLGRWEEEIARSGVDALAQAEELPARLRFGTGGGDTDTYLARSRHRWVLAARPRSAVAHRVLGGLMKLSRTVHPLGAMEFVHRREAWAIGFRRSLGPVRGVRFFRGTQWIALNATAADAVVRVDPAFPAWFRRSWIPDEAYFHTVIRSHPQLVVANAPTTFVLDTPARPTPGWMRLSLDDLPSVFAAGVPFARKVDPVERPEVIAAIDRQVDAESSRDATRTAQPSP
jgi:hypothetical protein